MGQCSHCKGTGRCQDDFHSGTRPLGLGEQEGVDHPSLVDHIFGKCPSCGDGNTEWRPACPHCEGTGKGWQTNAGTSGHSYSTSRTASNQDTNAEQTDNAGGALGAGGAGGAAGLLAGPLLYAVYCAIALMVVFSNGKIDSWGEFLAVASTLPLMFLLGFLAFQIGLYLAIAILVFGILGDILF